jgi:hypothetical protein
VTGGMVERGMPRPLRLLALCGLALALLAGCTSDDKKLATPASTSVAPLPTTVVPVNTSFTGQGSAQFCALAKTYSDKFANVGTANTPAQLRSISQDASTAISQAAAAAPAEIKADAQVVSNAFVALFAELQRANFDITKVSPTAFTSLQTPEVSTATTRFQAYLRTVCGTP